MGVLPSPWKPFSPSSATCLPHKSRSAARSAGSQARASSAGARAEAARASAANRIMRHRGASLPRPARRVSPASARTEAAAARLDLVAVEGLDRAVDELAGRGRGEEGAEHGLGHVEIAVAIAAFVPEIERRRLGIEGGAVDRARCQIVDAQAPGHQKPTSSRLSKVALPPALVVSVLVTRSAQKRGR